MSGHQTATTTHRTTICTTISTTIWTTALTTVRALTIGAVLIGGAVLGADTFVSANSVDDWAATEATCDRAGNVYRLDDPGTYAAFISTPTSTAVVEARGPHGEMLAISPATASNTAAVDLATGLRFGIAAPQVFDVQSSVLIHVRHDDSPYELVLVRLDGREGWSGLDIHPPVDQLVRDSDSCLIGDHPETMRIRTAGLHSDTTARQVFRITS